MSQATSFESRVERLGRRHAKMYENGIVNRLGSDGLISAHPRRRLPRFPLKGVIMVLLAALAFKGVLLGSLGSGVYQQRVDLLSTGSFLERAGGWVMQIDPATEFVANLVKPFVPAP